MPPSTSPSVSAPASASPSALVRSVRWSQAVRLMDGLVHDVRNPLNALAINVEILQEKLSRAAGGEVPAAEAKNLQAMREQIRRVNEMLGQFARFLAPSPGPPAVLSVAQVLREAAEVLSHAARRARVKLLVDAPDGPQAAVAARDPGALGFLVLGPLLRAMERAPEGGQVRASVRVEGGWVVFQVADSGLEEAEETEVERALAAAARDDGAELHVRGPQLRLSFPASLRASSSEGKVKPS